MNNAQNIVICFIGGTGGHFVASICLFLRNGYKFRPEKTGSLHNIRNEIVFFGGVLPRDNTLNSWMLEHDYVSNCQPVPLAIGHIRNLAMLQEMGWHVIYITFDDDDRAEINRRVHQKQSLPPIESITEDQYNMLKGGSWPTWHEYCNGARAEELHDRYVMLKNHDECLTWSYMIPTVSNKLCCVSFKEILYGYGLIDKLAAFLGINNFDCDYLRTYFDQYRQSQ